MEAPIRYTTHHYPSSEAAREDLARNFAAHGDLVVIDIEKIVAVVLDELVCVTENHGVFAQGRPADGITGAKEVRAIDEAVRRGFTIAEGYRLPIFNIITVTTPRGQTTLALDQVAVLLEELGRDVKLQNFTLMNEPHGSTKLHWARRRLEQLNALETSLLGVLPEGFTPRN
jgi:hypothetical protein